jgi:hypothetical protein
MKLRSRYGGIGRGWFESGWIESEMSKRTDLSMILRLLKKLDYFMSPNSVSDRSTFQKSAKSQRSRAGSHH